MSQRENSQTQRRTYLQARAEHKEIEGKFPEDRNLKEAFGSIPQPFSHSVSQSIYFQQTKLKHSERDYLII